MSEGDIHSPEACWEKRHEWHFLQLQLQPD